MKKHKILALLLTAVLALSLLAGCGGSSGGSSSAPADNSSSENAAVPAENNNETAAAQEASEGQSERIMQLGTAQGSSTLDPVNGYDYWYMLRYGVCETLMKFNMDMTPAPWLAAEMPTVSEDQLTWTVKIRDDAAFSTGEKLTAEKVKAAIERNYENIATAKAAFTMTEITADGQTLTITTETPSLLMPYLLADPAFVIYDTADLTDVADKGPIGTGPFVFSAFDAVTHDVSVVRNDNYWGGKVMCAGIDFHILADASTLNFALQNGELDGGYAVDVEFINNYVNDPAFIAQTSSSTRTSFGFMNQNPGHVLQDEVLRQAVIRLMDREGVCHSLLYDQYIPGITPLTSALPYGYDELNDINAFDPAGAVKLLDEAGYVDKDGDGYRDMPDGSPLEISITTYANRVEMPLFANALWMAGDEIGLRFKVEDTDQSTAWNKLVAGEYDICEMSIAMATSGDPENQLKTYFHSEGGYNKCGYANPEVDALFDELRGVSDVDGRIEIIKKIEQKLMDDSVALFLCYPVMNFVTKANVAGVTSHTSDYYWVSKDTGFTD